MDIEDLMGRQGWSDDTLIQGRAMKVIVTNKSENTITEQVWARETDEVGVMLSVAQLLQHAKDDSPWAPRTLEIRIEL